MLVLGIIILALLLIVWRVYKINSDPRSQFSKENLKFADEVIDMACEAEIEQTPGLSMEDCRKKYH